MGSSTARQVPYRRPCPSIFATRPRSSTTPARGIPSAPTGSARSRRCSSRSDWLGWDAREAPRATEEQLLRVHPRAYVERVEEMSARGAAFDLDTPTSPGSCEAASRAAGGACALVEALLEGGERTGFSVLRPPGHHAEPERAMGFCLFATVAIAARHALDALGAERVLVLDWDVHHGNGTNTIFHGSPEVLFASIHQYPFWPGSGALGDVGSGAGEGYSLNLPVPAGTGEAVFLSLVEHVVAPAARQFGPDLILVSAGLRRAPRRPARRPRARDGVVRGALPPGARAGGGARRARRRGARGRLRPRRPGELAWPRRWRRSRAAASLPLRSSGTRWPRRRRACSAATGTSERAGDRRRGTAAGGPRPAGRRPRACRSGP